MFLEDNRVCLHFGLILVAVNKVCLHFGFILVAINKACLHFCLMFFSDNKVCLHFGFLLVARNKACLHFCMVFVSDNKLCLHFCLMFVSDKQSLFTFLFDVCFRQHCHSEDWRSDRKPAKNFQLWGKPRHSFTEKRNFGNDESALFRQRSTSEGKIRAFHCQEPWKLLLENLQKGHI